MIAPQVRARIESSLDAIEADHGVEVLYAAESGSRAWGFPSPDSDYDVRFIYRHPADWYLSVRERRDVIETPIADDLDVSGWDLRKALRLFLRSNPALYEWLVSPIVYGERRDFGARLRALADTHYSLHTLALHYRNIVRHHQRDYLKGKDRVKLKKYMYAIRPICAALWLRDRGAMPPMNLQEILAGTAIAAPALAEIETLVARKAGEAELGEGPPIAAIDDWISASLEEIEAFCAGLEAEQPPLDVVNAFFREEIGV